MTFLKRVLTSQRWLHYGVVITFLKRVLTSHRRLHCDGVLNTFVWWLWRSLWQCRLNMHTTALCIDVVVTFTKCVLTSQRWPHCDSVLNTGCMVTVTLWQCRLTLLVTFWEEKRSTENRMTLWGHWLHCNVSSTSHINKTLLNAITEDYQSLDLSSILTFPLFLLLFLLLPMTLAKSDKIFNMLTAATESKRKKTFKTLRVGIVVHCCFRRDDVFNTSCFDLHQCLNTSLRWRLNHVVTIDVDCGLWRLSADVVTMLTA